MGQGVQAGVRVVHLTAVVQHQQYLLLDRVDCPHRAQVAVEDAEVVVVLELQHPVARPVGAPAARGLGQALPRRVQPLLEQGVQRADAGLAAVHRREHLDVARREAVACRQAAGDQVGDGRRRRGRVVGRHEETVTDVRHRTAAARRR